LTLTALTRLTLATLALLALLTALLATLLPLLTGAIRFVSHRNLQFVNGEVSPRTIYNRSRKLWFLTKGRGKSGSMFAILLRQRGAKWPSHSLITKSDTALWVLEMCSGGFVNG
jgi:hypothetical protein